MARLELRLSDDEKLALQAKADSAGVSMAELIKQAIRRVKTFTIEDKNIALAKNRELNRIGNNLNQIARWANTHKSSADTIEILSHLVAIEQEIKKL